VSTACLAWTTTGWKPTQTRRGNDGRVDVIYDDRRCVAPGREACERVEHRRKHDCEHVEPERRAPQECARRGEPECAADAAEARRTGAHRREKDGRTPARRMGARRREKGGRRAPHEKDGRTPVQEWARWR
jgi:hypothetical protein